MPLGGMHVTNMPLVGKEVVFVNKRLLVVYVYHVSM